MEGDSRNPIRLAGALVTGGKRKGKLFKNNILHLGFRITYSCIEDEYHISIVANS
jgi:hypothetical protein